MLTRHNKHYKIEEDEAEDHTLPTRWIPGKFIKIQLDHKRYPNVKWTPLYPQSPSSQSRKDAEQIRVEVEQNIKVGSSAQEIEEQEAPVPAEQIPAPALEIPVPVVQIAAPVEEVHVSVDKIQEPFNNSEDLFWIYRKDDYGKTPLYPITPKFTTKYAVNDLFQL